jgi:hypothetical protein
MSQQLIQQRQQQIESIYKPQEQFIQQQKAALPGQFDGQRSALEQAKVNAFRDVGLQAQRRGMFFSGFQPAEQARYLGEKFLPGMQDIAARQEQSRLGLLEKLIGLRTQKAGEMNTFREQLRREALERQQQEEAFRRQLEMQNRQFDQQRSLTSMRSSGGGGSSRGGGGGSGAGSAANLKMSLDAFAKSRGALSQQLSAKTGRDGKVSPAVFKAARQAAVRAGWSNDLFNRNFNRYINTTHAQDYM